MPIEFKKNRAIFRDEATVEEAEGLLEWLQTRPSAKADYPHAPTFTPLTCRC